jgi:hypothetical protein
VYAEPYDHTRWSQHVERVAALVEMAKTIQPRPTSVADLACGDGALASQWARWASDQASHPVRVILGDLVPGWPICGPIEDTIGGIGEVELFVLSEAVEHLDDPELVMRRIARHARWMLLSTPIGEIEPAINPEHYWGWDIDGIRELLESTGWTPREVRTLVPRDGGVYTFQLWLAERTVSSDGVPIMSDDTVDPVGGHH